MSVPGKEKGSVKPGQNGTLWFGFVWLVSVVVFSLFLFCVCFYLVLFVSSVLFSLFYIYFILSEK